MIILALLLFPGRVIKFCVSMLRPRGTTIMSLTIPVVQITTVSRLFSKIRGVTCNTLRNLRSAHVPTLFDFLFC